MSKFKSREEAAREREEQRRRETIAHNLRSEPPRKEIEERPVWHCPKCLSRMTVTSTRGAVRYLKCTRCGHLDKGAHQPAQRDPVPGT